MSRKTQAQKLWENMENGKTRFEDWCVLHGQHQDWEKESTQQCMTIRVAKKMTELVQQRIDEWEKLEDLHPLCFNHTPAKQKGNPIVVPNQITDRINVCVNCRLDIWRCPISERERNPSKCMSLLKVVLLKNTFVKHMRESLKFLRWHTNREPVYDEHDYNMKKAVLDALSLVDDYIRFRFPH